MAAAMGYARVSTSWQSASGVSLEAQRGKIEAYCDLHGLDLVGIEADEGISGKRADNRPALQCVLMRLATGEANALVILKLDRLSRSTRDVIDIVDRSGREGWSLHSIGESLDTGLSHGRFFVTVLGALAQLEREQIGERVALAWEQKRKRGERTAGSLPYGYRVADDGKALLPDPDEQEVIDRIRDRRRRGSTWSLIARELNAIGKRTKWGKLWSCKQVKRAVEHADRRGCR